MNLRSNKGITLTVLVVTIILMMILTGLTISFIADDNGLIERSKIEKNIIVKTQENIEDEIDSMYNALQQ